VTLQPIDGGANYYCAHGFTNACNGGWDNSSFFPIGPYYCQYTNAADASVYTNVGWNTCFRSESQSSLALMRQNHVWEINNEDGGSPETPGMGSETVGLLSYDEPGSYSQGVTTPLSSAPNADQNGRFWWVNNTWNFLHWGPPSGTPNNSQSAFLSSLVSTPNGTKRHIDLQSIDIYWFSGRDTQYSTNTDGGYLYGQAGALNDAQTMCGCRYGDMLRPVYGTNVGMSDPAEASYQTANPAPLFSIVEDGDVYDSSQGGGSYITPPEMNWSAWSSIIHGARGLIYFDHTFFGPGISDFNAGNPYYQTPQGGQSVSIDAQLKATDALVQQEAPAINSPTALGYVNVSPAPTTFGGIETRATDNNGTFTIFADTRDAETASNVQATFTTADGYTGPVTVVGENRTVQATNGVFADAFANGSTVHVYQIP
jgi:hypothetical protein